MLMDRLKVEVSRGRDATKRESSSMTVRLSQTEERGRFDRARGSSCNKSIHMVRLKNAITGAAIAEGLDSRMA